MPRKWSKGVDRIAYEAIDGEYDRLKKTAKAHGLHDSQRSAKPSPGRTALSGPTSSNANTPKKRRWGR
ncbi:hypothetical protein [Streptomyces olivochromogenes]|uniref:hypothetical protein n=1 Tax=Streptomyces olivochromogenes TaxID=1963 RepID=UPI001F3CCA72|nr:hypothetical protein [Streptomyces olivochromogenes]MCF3130607.1 hypothetical protein [Streptomyces olivochromogenes]